MKKTALISAPLSKEHAFKLAFFRAMQSQGRGSLLFAHEAVVGEAQKLRQPLCQQGGIGVFQPLFFESALLIDHGREPSTATRHAQAQA